MLFLTARLPPTDADVLTYETRAVQALEAAGRSVTKRTFAVVDDGKNGERHAEIVGLLAAEPDGAPVLVSSTVAPLLGSVLRSEARRLRTVVIAHRPSHRDPRFATVSPSALDEVDAATLPFARRVVVPSLHTAMSIGVHGVLPDQLAVVLAAADRAPIASGGRATAEPLTLVMAAPLVRDAGHDVALAALATLTRFEWRLTCVAPASDAAWHEYLSSKADDLGLSRRLRWLTAASASEIKAAYHVADLALQASRYDPHGIGPLEALARGLPLVATHAGATAALVAKDAGIVVQPDDPRALAAALQALMSTPELFERLLQGAARARDDVRSWSRVGAELEREVQLACR